MRKHTNPSGLPCGIDNACGVEAGKGLDGPGNAATCVSFVPCPEQCGAGPCPHPDECFNEKTARSKLMRGDILIHDEIEKLVRENYMDRLTTTGRNSTTAWTNNMKRITPVILVALLLVGCNSIPLTNNGARPLNRIYSGYELLTVLHAECHALVVDQVITQQQVDDHVYPVLDEAESILTTAEAAWKLGNAGETQSKTQQAQTILLGVREQLKRVRERK